MAKRKRTTSMTAIAFGPLTDEQRRKMAAEDAARTIVDTDPELQAKRMELSREILATSKRVMSGNRPYVKRRK